MPKKYTKCGEVKAFESLLIKAEQAAAICNVSIGGWHKYVRAGLIPKPIRIGSSCFWGLNRLKQWVELNCPDAEMFERMLKTRKLNSYFARTRSIGKPFRNRYLAKINQRKSIDELQNNYVKQVLCVNTNLRHSDIPEEMIAAKRVQLKITRRLRRI